MFDKHSLDILKAIPRDVRVKILMSRKEDDIIFRDIEQHFINEWKRICDQIPPETHFYLFSTPSGNTPINQIYIITDNAGLEVSHSTSSLNNSDVVITYLNMDQKIHAENNLINSLLINSPLKYNDERLFMRTFSLDV